MSASAFGPLSLNAEEFEVLAELLESERTKLLVEIRHTDHRLFRDELRHRLNAVEALLARFGGKPETSPETSQKA
jgi:hypothetical protein